MSKGPRQSGAAASVFSLLSSRRASVLLLSSPCSNFASQVLYFWTVIYLQLSASIPGSDLVHFTLEKNWSVLLGLKNWLPFKTARTVGTLPRHSGKWHSKLLHCYCCPCPGCPVISLMKALISSLSLRCFTLALTFYGGVCATLPRTLWARLPLTAISPMDLVKLPGWAMAGRRWHAGLSGTVLVPSFLGATRSQVPP